MIVSENECTDTSLYDMLLMNKHLEGRYINLGSVVIDMTRLEKLNLLGSF